jgi:hypothetical protein
MILDPRCWDRDHFGERPAVVHVIYAFQGTLQPNFHFTRLKDKYAPSLPAPNDMHLFRRQTPPVLLLNTSSLSRSLSAACFGFVMTLYLSRLAMPRNACSASPVGESCHGYGCHKARLPVVSLIVSFVLLPANRPSPCLPQHSLQRGFWHQRSLAFKPTATRAMV